MLAGIQTSAKVGVAELTLITCHIRGKLRLFTYYASWQAVTSLLVQLQGVCSPFTAISLFPSRCAASTNLQPVMFQCYVPYPYEDSVL